MCSTRTASQRLQEWEGRLVLKRPFPHMLRTVWRDPARYERDWQVIPGCYVTGDVATRDKDGYIAVLGRYDDVLNVAGHRIGTAEVESALVSHPAVAEAAAIGVPDPMKGETIKVFVQVRADHVASEALSAALIEHVRRNSARSRLHRRWNLWLRCPRPDPEKFCAAFSRRRKQASTRAMFPRWKADRRKADQSAQSGEFR